MIMVLMTILSWNFFSRRFFIRFDPRSFEICNYQPFPNSETITIEKDRNWRIGILAGLSRHLWLEKRISYLTNHRHEAWNRLAIGPSMDGIFWVTFWLIPEEYR